MPLVVIHHYHHHHGGAGEDSEQLSRIEETLQRMENRMSELDDELASIKATQDITLATIASTKAGVESILAKLAAVPTAGLTKDQQAALDAIRDEGVTIAQNLSAVNTEASPAQPATATAPGDESAPPPPPANPPV